MAKGNTGNLLQHFVALTVAEMVVESWGKPEEAIEYIDCFSMAPVEPIDSAASDFKQRVKLIATGDADDVLSKSLRSFWNEKYPDGFPTVKKGFLYPNTATLLQRTFEQKWNMRLHEIDEAKREELTAWSEENAEDVGGSVNGAWRQSDQIMKTPVPRDCPCIVMLDPNQVCKDLKELQKKADSDSYLTARSLHYISGEQALDLLAHNSKDCPKVVLMFSYSENNPSATHHNVEEMVEGINMQMQRITAVDKSRAKPVTHQGWVVYRDLEALEEIDLQEAWEAWHSAQPASEAS